MKKKIKGQIWAPKAGNTDGCLRHFQEGFSEEHIVSMFRVDTEDADDSTWHRTALFSHRCDNSNSNNYEYYHRGLTTAFLSPCCRAGNRITEPQAASMPLLCPRHRCTPLRKHVCQSVAIPGASQHLSDYRTPQRELINTSSSLDPVLS
jgi:hypothetical protein